MVPSPDGILRGVIPVAPTVFHDDEELDVEGQRRVTDFLVDAGSVALCVLANYSEQFSLEEPERRLVVEASIESADGRLPVIVTTSHFSGRVAARRSQEAQDMGADMLMLMPPFYGATMSVPAPAVREWFLRIAEVAEIPIVVQDAPISCTPLSVELMANLAREIPLIRHVKIEVPHAATKIRALAEEAGESLPGLYDGEEGVTLMHDLDAGAQATMTSAAVPEKFAGIMASFHAGNRDQAEADWDRLLPLIQFENRQCGLSAAKFLMAEGGVITSARTRSPIAPLHPAVSHKLLTMAKVHDALVLNWGK